MSISPMPSYMAAASMVVRVKLTSNLSHWGKSDVNFTRLKISALFMVDRVKLTSNLKLTLKTKISSS